MTAPDDDDGAARRDREAILARRQRFVVAALAGLTTSTLATACRPRPQPCLRIEPIDMPSGRDTERRADSNEPETEALADAKLEGADEAQRPVEAEAAPGSLARK